MTQTIVRLADLREAPLDVAEVMAAVQDDACGALALFVGQVRNHDVGKGVGGLDYSAHPQALAKLREVCEAIADEYDVRSIAAVHRTGPLEIGEMAVVVATTSPHRDEAFSASRALIDRLKAEVPIWKHQRFSDGTTEWVGAAAT